MPYSGLKSGIAFHGAKRVYNRICHFHLRMNKTGKDSERVITKTYHSNLIFFLIGSLGEV